MMRNYKITIELDTVVEVELLDDEVSIMPDLLQKLVREKMDGVIPRFAKEQIHRPAYVYVEEVK